MVSKQSFPEFLAESRNSAGFSQAEVAAAFGYETPQFISNWERGISYPPINILKTLAKMYKVNADNLLDRMEEAMIAKITADLHRKFKRSSSK